MDPQSTKDGRPYGPWRYKEIVREMYYISKTINTSYKDLEKITPTERNYLLEFIADDLKREKEAMEKMKQDSKR